MRFLVIGFGLVLLAVSAFSATIHVPADQPTIQAGINAAVNGDTVLVAPGTYLENVTFGSVNGITLKSEGGRDVTIVESTLGNTPVIRIPNSADNTSAIIGFTVMGATGVACIDMVGGRVVEDCHITGGTRQGIIGWIGTKIISDCLIDNNRGLPNADGIAFYGDSCWIVRNRICNNSMSAIFAPGGVVTIKYNVILDNDDWGIFGNGEHQIINNTVVGNPNGGIHLGSESPDSRVLNNIVVENGYGIALIGGGLVDYNDTWDNHGQGEFPGTNGISDDPLFADRLGGNLALMWNSPCINSGDPNPMFNDPDGTRNDLGAIYYANLPLAPVLLPIGDTSIYEGMLMLTVIEGWDPNGNAPQLQSEDLPTGALFVDSGNGRGCFTWTPTYSQSGVYSVLFIASDGELADSESVTITVTNVIRPPFVATLAATGETRLSNLTNHIPRFLWLYTDPEPLPQTHFEIAVGTDPDWTYSEMWNPAPLVSGDTFVIYNGSPLIDGQTYYLRLRVSNGTLWSDWYNTTFRMNSVPSVPVIANPSGDQLVTSTPVLWVDNSSDNENDPLLYDFRLFVDTAYGEPELIEGLGIPAQSDSTGWTVAASLQENARYHWQARSYDGYEYSDWTSSVSFYLDQTPEAPAPYTLISPPLAPNVPEFHLKAAFDWVDAPDPDPFDTVRYTLEISISPNFTFTYTLGPFTQSDHILVDSLEFNTHYWWRVKATDKDGFIVGSGATHDFWTWLPGDVDYSHNTDGSDLQWWVDFMYFGMELPSPRFVLDLDGDCVLDGSDSSVLIDYIFFNGPPWRGLCVP